MRILVTAGGTREYIDPVRFISNASTGKMGYAVAEYAKNAGHEVTLITAPVAIMPPQGVEIVPVETSLQMFGAVKQRFGNTDCLIMAAAVSDYRPANESKTKIKKSQRELTIHLEPTTDIIKWAGEHKTCQIIVGFALEDTNLLENAQDKFNRKNMDMIVANSPAAISAQASEVHILTKNTTWQHFPSADKAKTAQRIIEFVQQIESHRSK